MSINKIEPELLKKIEHLLFLVLGYFKKNNQGTLQEILEKATFEVSDSEPEYGDTEYTLSLIIPQTLLIDITDNIEDIENEIYMTLNKYNESMEINIRYIRLKAETSDIRSKKNEEEPIFDIISPEDENQIWGDKAAYKVFISHKAEYKDSAKIWKEKLSFYGISSFVAHEDIDPVKMWPQEIEKALLSMDAFVALITEGFNKSCWTNQEIGFAYARKVKIVPIRFPKDPQGFISQIQAFSPKGTEGTAKEIVGILIKETKMLDVYIKAVSHCNSYEHGNILAGILPYILELSDDQAQRLVDAFNNSYQARESYGLNGSKPSAYGHGLPFHLERITNQTYILKDGKIELEKE